MTWTAGDSSPKERITAEVERRIHLDTVNMVADTRAKASMERTLRQEYHGRALFELLQNARDAWRADGRSAGGDGRVLIRVEASPALVVANQGEPLSAERILYSIAKFGASTKPVGTAIGHKGIGFKAVLELTECPEIYARPAPGSALAVQVGYDPVETMRRVREVSLELDALDRLRSDDPANPAGGPFAVPILEYPLWLSSVVAEIDDLDEYDTIVRLPWREETTGVAVSRSRESWLDEIRRLIGGISDAMVLLLGAFAEFRLEDQAAGTPGISISRRTLERGRLDDSNDTQWELAEVRRPDRTSRWLAFSRSVPDDDQAGVVSAEISVSFRLTNDGGAGFRLIDPTDGGDTGAGHFHLFFPTRIPSHLPFLVHGYFEVDASRKGFAGDADSRNRRLLEALGDLTVDVIERLAAGHCPVTVDVSSLADLLAVTEGEPSDPLAADFRHRVLDRLDAVPYVPVLGHPEWAAPMAVLTDDRGRLRELLEEAFGIDQVAAQGLHLPMRALGDAGYRFLTRRAIARTHGEYGLSTERLAALLGTGAAAAASSVATDGRFAALLELCSALLGARQPGVDEVLSDLHTDASAVVVPVVDAETPGGRRLRRPAWVAEQSPDAPILARSNRGSSGNLAPPRELELDFVADGLVSPDLDPAASRLGIRPYLTDTALDGLARIAPGLADDASATGVLRFVWQLLVRERQGQFAVRAAGDAIHQVEPGAFHWANPVHRGEQPDQRRAHALSQLRLPTLAGTWAPAGTLAFGVDWARWFELKFPDTALTAARARLYEDVSALAPGDHTLLGPPDAVLPLLDQPDSHSLEEEDVELDELRLAFLLRVGVWEGLPVESYIDLRTRSAAERDPWPDAPGRQRQWDEILAARGFEFGVHAAHDVETVRVGEDHRLTWDLEVNPFAASQVLDRMAPLLGDLSRMRLFCDGCHGHSSRYRSDIQPSLLAHQLRTRAWVPVYRGGTDALLQETVRADEAWYVADSPADQYLNQSPLQFLRLTDRGLSAAVAELAGIATLDGAPNQRIVLELERLKDLLLEDPVVAVGTPGRRQAFIRIHNLLYAQLAAIDPDAPILPEVLAVLGDRLTFVPPTDACFDSGSLATYRRWFAHEVAFSTLPRHETGTARRLGIPTFSLDLELRAGPPGRDITPDVRPFVHDLITDFFALLVHHRLGGREGLVIGSPEFILRANRWAALRIVQLDDVVIDARLAGTEKWRPLGVDREDLYLDQSSPGHPILYTDMGTDQIDRLRRLIGPYLALLVDRADFDAEFRLLVGFDAPSDREAFLADRGITHVQLEDLEAALTSAGLSGIEHERRWWTALLPLLRAPGSVSDGDPRDSARTTLASAGRLHETWIEALVDLGGSLAVRRDTGDASALALLDQNDVPLQELDRRLRDLGDEGLALPQAARNALNAWVNRHHRAVATALALGPQRFERNAALDAHRHWRAPDKALWHVHQSDEALLADVVTDLRRAKLKPDPAALAERAESHLAELLDFDMSQLNEAVRTLYSDPDDLAAAEGQALRQWRAQLRPILIAALTNSHDPDYELRRAALVVDRLLADIDSVRSLSERIASSAAGTAELRAALAEAVRNPNQFDAPDRSALDTIAETHAVHPDHLARVRRLLQRDPDQRIRTIRKNLAIIETEGLRPRLIRVTPEGNNGGPDQPRPKVPKQVVPNKVTRDPKRDKRLGDEAEQLALAAVIAALPIDDPYALGRVLDDIANLLRRYFKLDEDFYEIKRALVDDILTQDERLDALGQFLHLSNYSDNFACDIVGVLPAGNGELRPLLLEVKSTADASVLISAAEWRQASASGDDYALMIVHRPTRGQPHCLDVIIDPHKQFPLGSTNPATYTWLLKIGGAGVVANGTLATATAQAERPGSESLPSQ